MKNKGVRIYDLARRLAIPSREILELLKKRGIEATSHMNSVDEETVALILKTFGTKKPDKPQQQPGQPQLKRRPKTHTFVPPQQQASRTSQKRAESQISRRRKPRSQYPQPKQGESPESQDQRGKRQRRFQPRDDTQKPAGERERGRGFTRRRESFPKKEGGQREYPKKKEVGGPETKETPFKKGRRPTPKPQEEPGKDQRRRPGKKVEGTRNSHRPFQYQGGRFRRRRSPKATVPREPVKVEIEEKPPCVILSEAIAVKDLADQMAIPPAKVIRHLMTMGVMANVNQMLEPDAARSIAEHFEVEVKEHVVEETSQSQEEVIDESQLQPRPPVVTIMGHVDHGKTTLLDAIRESKIADSESGGITQHIGAYVVEVGGQDVAFLDTPGHEAFTAMRARGAQVTDEVVLVVAADDGIMPQTIEAIDHARDADVPIIVAINKTDLPGANPDRVMQELTKHGLTPEEWGGETICVKVSAKQRTNLDELLEMIVLQAEMLELKANPNCLAKGVVVEAMLDKARGPVATVLVQQGTLGVGNPFVAGLHPGKVRAMQDDRGRRVDKVTPSYPVEVLGLTGVPVAGDVFEVFKNERTARQVAENRQAQQQRAEFLKPGKITLEELHQHIKEGGFQELRIVIKADVHGSVEALTDALERLSTEQVRLQVIHGGVGAINESDVMLAVVSNAIVLGFNVRPVAKAREMAEKEQIDVRLYTIIYQAIDDIKKAMEGLLEPTYKEILLGQATVQATFSVPKIGTVAGCRITNGKFTRNAVVKLFRDDKQIYSGNIASLRRVKEDVREVLTGYECGIKLENYNDVKEGDIIEAYTLEKIIMTLEEAAAYRQS